MLIQVHIITKVYYKKRISKFKEQKNDNGKGKYKYQRER